MSLLNMDNVPGGLLSGVSDDLLDYITSESNERYLTECGILFDNYLREQEESTTNLDIPREIEELLDDVENQSIPKTTKQQMKLHSENFRKFLRVKSLDTKFEKVPASILNKYLRYFYCELRTTDGKYYAPASLICIRAAIQRHLSSAEVKSTYNIISGDEFKGANCMLKAMISKYLSSPDKKKPEEMYPPIEDQDMIKIRTYFNRSSSKILQEEVAFNTLYYFGLRGRETLRFLEKDSFSIECDSEGREFIRLVGDRLSKNCKASLKPADFENAKRVRCYALPEKPDECPVACLKLYLSKIPVNVTDFFPMPIKTSTNSQHWYSDKKCIGKNTLSNLMSDLSSKLILKKRYTNHCIRVTAVVVLKEQGFDNHDISMVTGHKDARSVNRYAKKRKDESYFKTAEALQIGTSKTESKKIITVENNGKVIVTSKRNNENQETSTDVCTSVPTNKSSVQICFSGNFSNCQFNIHDSV